MKRKTSTLPTQIWTFGCRAPLVGGEVVADQIWHAHRYQNKLVEIENKHRDRYREIRSRYGLAALETEFAELDTQVKAQLDALKKRRADARTRVKDPAASAEIKAKKAERAEVKGRLVALKEEIKKNPDFEAETEKLKEDKKVDVHVARAATATYWGTYLLVERAVEAAVATSRGQYVRYRRWGHGEGRVGVQLQGGRSVAKVMSGQDSRLRLEISTESEAKKPRGVVHIRVGSDASKKPLWASFPVLYSRALPEDGVIKWAWIQKTKVGTHFRYRLQLSVESATFAAAPPKAGLRAALNLGWRQRDNGVRVAYVVDENKAEFEIVIPPHIGGAMDHADSLRAIQDREFDKIKAIFSVWLAEPPVVLPEWLTTRIENFSQWRSTQRLAAVVTHWRTNRFDGDEEIFTVLEAWRKQFRHLYDWESFGRRKALNRRREFFRLQARALCERYAEIITAKIDLRDLAKKAEPEEEQVLPRPAREKRQKAAPSEFVAALKLMAPKFGTTLTFLAAGLDLTGPCHNCGTFCEWNRAILEHTCESCGAHWDQDANACHNSFDLRTYSEAAE